MHNVQLSQGWLKTPELKKGVTSGGCAWKKCICVL